MAEIIHNYFAADWRLGTHTCPCGWSGDTRAMVMHLHEEVTDYACPTCESTVLIVNHPDLEQVREAASHGNVEAQQQLALVEEALAAHRRD